MSAPRVDKYALGKTCYVCDGAIQDVQVELSTQLDEAEFDRVVDRYSLIHCEGDDSQFDDDGNVLVCARCIARALTRRCVVCDDEHDGARSDDDSDKLALTDDSVTRLVAASTSFTAALDVMAEPFVCSSCMNEVNAVRRCAGCDAFVRNAEHWCPVYDGEPCSTCGGPTLSYTVGAPGYGSGIVCRDGHRVELTVHGVLTPEQTR